MGTRTAVAFVALLTAIVLLSASASAATPRPGSLDRGFGHSGFLELWDPFPAPEAIGGLAAGRDGRIVVASSTTSNWRARPFVPPEGILIVRRLLANGVPDGAFGRNGVAALHPSDGWKWEARAVQLTAGAQPVIAARSYRERTGGGFDTRHHVLRFTSTGQLDPTFGAGGVVTTSTPWLFTLRLLADDRIVGIGVSNDGTTTQLVRLLPDGSPDGSFGNGGQAAVAGVTPSGMRTHGGGAVTIAGTSGDSAVVARVGSDGRLDPGFGGDGLATIAPPAGRRFTVSDLVVVPGGGVRVAGDLQRRSSGVDRTAALAGLTARGAPDRRFGGDGWARAAWPIDGALWAEALERDHRGALVVAGDAGEEQVERSLVVRFLPSGRLDRSFGRLGQAVHGEPGITTRAFGLASDGDALLVTAGTIREVSGWYDPLVSRLQGTVDRSRPQVRLWHVPRRCVDRSFRIRVRVIDPSPIVELGVRLDGRRLPVWNRRHARVTVPAGRLRAGVHRITVVARDGADNRRVRTVRFGVCR